MKAFWWFKDKLIAGMARPGFNAIHWHDLTLAEGVLFGWLGQFSDGPAPLASFRQHVLSYGPKVFPFFGLNQESGLREMQIFAKPAGILQTMQAVAKKTGTYGEFSIANDELHLRHCANRLQDEIAFLKSHDIRHVVTLTEEHHSRDALSEHFTTHHFRITDLTAPSLEQAQGLADLIKRAQQDGEPMVAHCLAGIGRTSTMLLAAHILLGEDPQTLIQNLAERNPSYQLKGGQGEFINGLLAESLSKVQSTRR